MGELQKICLDFIAIASLVIGTVSALISLLLIFNPQRLKSVGLLMNRNIYVEKKFANLNVYLPTGGLTYRFNYIFGTALICGSAFVLVFLFRKLQLPPIEEPISEILLNALALLGKLAAFVGIIVGLFLMFAPEAMQRIEAAMNRNFDTQQLVDSLNAQVVEIDSVFFRFPKLFGICGTIASGVLIYLGVHVLYHPPSF
jgi:hypothetical protein